MSHNITLKINGISVQAEEGQHVLEAALEAGIYVPHLCHHPDLTPLGSCKLCVVEHNGNVVSSCNLKAEEGMEIRTESEEITRRRHTAMELILAAHPEDCSTCPKYGNCELQTLTQYLGVSAESRRHRKKDFSLDDRNPLFDHDSFRCVLCGRCIRMCQKVRGVKALDYHKKGREVYAGVPADSLLKDEGCRFCGACAEVCPTGAIRDKEHLVNLNKSREESLVPCRNTCPAGTNIPRYVRLVKEGDYAGASAVIREKLPIPAILGHVCSHPCEEGCRRSELNEPVSIRNLKLAAVERDEEQEWKQHRKQLPDSGRKVAVIGAGPAGLTAAYYLRKQGHEVTVFESLPVAGGMPRVGIPAYRIPRDVIEQEVEEIREIGVEIRTGTRVDNYAALSEEYDAVLSAVGAHQGVRLPIKGNELAGVYVNIDFLRKTALGEQIELGERVVVLGGGNVAFDCARTAVRLGAKEVHMACLEDEETIPGDAEEIEAAEKEGIRIHYRKSFTEVQGEKGRAAGIGMIDVKSMRTDPERGLQIETEPGSESVIAADNIIFATGQRPDITEEAGVTVVRGNRIQTAENMQTSCKGVFAAGDAVYGTKSVIEAVASGRAAAEQIDRYLGGNGDISETLAAPEIRKARIGKEEGFASRPRIRPDEMDPDSRTGCFERVEAVFSREQACAESSRCLQCDLRMDIKKPMLWNEYSASDEEAKA